MRQKSRDGNNEELIKIEQEASNKLLEEIHKYPWQKINGSDKGSSPGSMRMTKEMICVGTSILIHLFLEDLGIKHFALSMHSHSAIMIEGIDGRKYYADPASILSDREIKDIGKGEGAYQTMTLYLIDSSIQVQVLDPEEGLMSQIFHNKGDMLDNLGRKEEAINCSDKAIGLNPDSAEVYANKGNVLFALGRNEEAIKCYDKAIELLPNIAEVYHNKGLVLDSLGRIKEAEIYDYAYKILIGNYGNDLFAKFKLLESKEKKQIRSLIEQKKYKEMAEYLFSLRLEE